MTEGVKPTAAGLRQIWKATDGKAWEPPDPKNPVILWMIDAGYLRRVDGRCGFERFKDSMVDWTPAGRAALNPESKP